MTIQATLLFSSFITTAAGFVIIHVGIRVRGLHLAVLCLMLFWHVATGLAFITWGTTSHAWSRLLSAGPRGALWLGASADPLVSVAWKLEKG